MWRLYWRITNGYWKDDLCSPDDILHFWLHIPQVTKIFKNNKNEKNSEKLLALLYIALCMALEPLQFIVYYSLLPFQIFSEWFCNLGKD